MLIADLSYGDPEGLGDAEGFGVDFLGAGLIIRDGGHLRGVNTAATIYLVIGSVHEESRLREAFGEDYDAYLNSDVPFYVPLPDRSGLELTSAVANLEGVPQ